MNKKDIVIIKASRENSTLDKMIDAFQGETACWQLDLSSNSKAWENVIEKGFTDCLILFATALDKWGTNLEMLRFITSAYEKNKNVFNDCVAAFMVSSETDLYTKSFTAQVSFILNSMGAIIPGHPLTEAVANFANFKTWKKTMNLELEEICYAQCVRQRDRLMNFSLTKSEKPRLLVLHASNIESSNTLALWRMVKENLHGIDVREVHVENGSVMDCKGCSFKACMHFGKQQRCFYGGAMVDSIYPEVEKANGIVWVSPNYNDSVSANLMAVVNRLTALYRVTPFYDKLHFSIVVSGNSGGDSVVKQLMNSLCVNKGFTLAPHSFLTTTANDPGSIKKIPGIEEKAKEFAETIKRYMKE